MSFGGPLLIAQLTSLLGIRPGMNVSILNPPAGFMEALLPLPDGACLIDDARLGLDLVVFFTQKKTELVEKLPHLARKLSVTGAIWVAYPEGQDAVHFPTEEFVRLAALEMGLTDTKKLVLDPAWSALRLQTRSRPPRAELPRAEA
jgi:hypothetical protein